MSDASLQALGQALRADLAAWSDQTLGWFAVDRLLAADWHVLAATETAAFAQLVHNQDLSSLAVWLTSGFIPPLSDPPTSPTTEPDAIDLGAGSAWEPFVAPSANLPSWPAASEPSSTLPDAPEPAASLPAAAEHRSVINPPATQTLARTRRLTIAQTPEFKPSAVLPSSDQRSTSRPEPAMSVSKASTFVTPTLNTDGAIRAVWPDPAAAQIAKQLAPTPAPAVPPPPIQGLAALAQWVQATPAALTQQVLIDSSQTGLAVEMPIVEPDSALGLVAPLAQDFAAQYRDQTLPPPTPTVLEFAATSQPELDRSTAGTGLHASDPLPPDALVLLAAQAPADGVPDHLFSTPAKLAITEVAGPSKASTSLQGDPERRATGVLLPVVEFAEPSLDQPTHALDRRIVPPAAPGWLVPPAQIDPQPASSVAAGSVMPQPSAFETAAPLAIETVQQFAPTATPAEVDIDAVLTALTRALQREYQRLYGG